MEEQNIDIREVKKNNKSSVIIIVILIIIVLGLSSYIVYDKMLSKSNNETVESSSKSNNTKKEVAKKLNEAEVEVLMKQIDDYNMNFAKNYPLDNVSKISQLNLFLFAIGKTNNNLDINELDKVVSSYFSNELRLNRENIICNVDNLPLYNYDSETNTYVFNINHPGHGGSSGGVNTVSYYLEGSILDNEITVNVHNLYGITCDDICGPNNSYYKSIYDSNKRINALLGDPTSDDEYNMTDDAYNEVKNELPITTYKFIKDTKGYYGLKSVSIK